MRLRFKLDGVEDTALSLAVEDHIDNSPSSALSQILSIFCIGWVSIVTVGIVLYSRYKDRLASEKLDVASTVAHEFRTPISGMSVLIESLIADPLKDTDKVNDYLLKMKSSNQRLHQISEHFFIEGSLKQKNLKLEKINLTDWLSRQWAKFSDAHQNAKIEKVYQVSEVVENVLIDQTLLALALQNILRNAYHYTESGSITLSTVRAENRIGIVVTDTGKGMDEELLSTAFQKYSRGEDKLSRETEGLGLGLYLAQQVAELHDGSITIESKLGKGSEVTLWIIT